jgi:hypothetical protein
VINPRAASTLRVQLSELQACFASKESSSITNQVLSISVFNQSLVVLKQLNHVNTLELLTPLHGRDNGLASCEVA